MITGKGNRCSVREPATVPLGPPNIPDDLTWDRIIVTAVGIRATDRPGLSGYTVPSQHGMPHRKI
jgi:hypothetical protein